MKLYLVVLLVSAGVALGRVHKHTSVDKRNHVKNKDYLTKTNRVPKEQALLPQEESSEEMEATWLDTCDECKNVVQQIDTYLQDETKIQELKNMLSLVCDVLPGSEKDECKSLVSNLDFVIHELQPLLKNPTAFCQTIHLCGARGRKSYFSKLGLMALKYRLFKGTLRNDALCDECKFAITELKAVWDQKSIQDEAKQLLDGLCSQLGSYKATCDSLVNTYFPLIVQEIDRLLSDPANACSEIGLCSSKLFSARGHSLVPSRRGKVTLHRDRHSEIMNFLRRGGRIQTKDGTSTGCSVCVYSVGVILETLKLDPALLQSWASGIENICSAFPAQNWQPGCQDFLSIYLEPVLRVTVDSISAKQVCSFFKACTSSTYERRFEYQSLKQRSSSSGVGNEVVCESCRLMAEFLKTECSQQSFQTEVKNELKQVCNFVPGQYADACEQAVEQYVPYVFNLAVTELDPDTICPELSLCPQRQVVEEERSDEEQLIEE